MKRRDCHARISSLAMTLITLIAFTCSTPSWAAPSLDTKTCHAITSVTYQPGVDAYGRKVAPVSMSHNYLENPAAFSGAALNQAPKLAPNEITLPLTIELMSYLSEHPSKKHLGDSEATIGVLHIKGTSIYLNDTPITQDQKAKLMDLCK